VTLWAGTIADGSIVDGTWQDDDPAVDGVRVRSGTSDAKNEFHEVFSFTAPVTCAER